MGMSASQVRFLSLQHRKHNIGNQLTALSNKKMALSRDMNKAAKNYTNKLNQTRLKWTNDSGYNYTPLSYDLLMRPNELNCEKPYIITDKNGKVVVDDKKIFYDVDKGELVKGTSQGLSYQEIASMISTYSGLDKDGNTTYNNISNVKGTVGWVTDGDGNVSIDARNVTSGGQSVEDSKYEISVGNQVYNYDSSLRFDIMEKIGLIPDSVKIKFKQTLDALYGNKAGADFPGSMENLLKMYDINHEYLIDDVPENAYSTYFGDFRKSIETGDFEINGGCAMGNLALAKAYQREYQTFLRTPIVHDLYKNGTTNTTTETDSYTGSDGYANSITRYKYSREEVLFDNIDNEHLEEYKNNHGNSTFYESLDERNGITESYDVKHSSESTKYIYDEEENTGISRRIANLLYVTDDKDTQVKINEDGSSTITINDILSNLKFYKEDQALDNFLQLHDYRIHDYNVGENGRKIDDYDTEYDEWTWTSIAAQRNDYGDVVNSSDSSNGEFIIWYDDTNDDGRPITLVDSWAYLYDSELCGRSEGDDYGVTLRSCEYVEDTDDLFRYHQILNLSNLGNNNGYTVYGVLESLKDSFNSIPGVDKEGVDYAYTMTKFLYNDGIEDFIDDGKNYFTDYRTTCNATRNSYNKYGTYWADRKGLKHTGRDVTAVNTTHMINAFCTFYEMYMSVDGDVGTKKTKNINGIDMDYYEGGRIVNTASTDKIYIPVVTNTANTFFSSSVADKLKDGSQNDAISQIEKEWTSTLTKEMVDDGSGNQVQRTEVGSNFIDYFYKTEQNVYNRETNTWETEYLEHKVRKYNDGNKVEFHDITNNILEKVVEKNVSNKIIVSDYTASFDDNGNFIFGSNNIAAKTTYEKSGSSVTADIELTNPIDGGTFIDSDEDEQKRGKAKTIQIGSNSNGYSIIGVAGITDASEGITSDSWQELSNKYVIVSAQDSSVIDEQFANMVIDANYPTEGKFTTKITTRSDDKYGAKLDQLVASCEERVKELMEDLESCFAGISPKIMEYFDGLFKRISEKGWVLDNKVNSPNATMSQNYLNAMLDNNEYYITEYNSATNSGSYDYVTKQATSVMKIYKVHDDDLENVALSEYEAEKTLISNKERVIDARMQKLETEQEAISTELQSIKKVRNENIEKTFKIFA